MLECDFFLLLKTYILFETVKRLDFFEGLDVNVGNIKKELM